MLGDLVALGRTMWLGMLAELTTFQLVLWGIGCGIALIGIGCDWFHYGPRKPFADVARATHVRLVLFLTHALVCWLLLYVAGSQLMQATMGAASFGLQLGACVISLSLLRRQVQQLGW